jgi:hypothetical protein
MPKASESVSQTVENKVSSEPVIDLDSFMTIDSVDSVWINGLMVYLTPAGGTLPRSLSEWRSVLVTYQGLK